MFRRFLVAGDCMFVRSGRAGKSVSTLFGVLPRRFSSSSVAACINSNSPSLKCLTVLRRLLGRTYRRGSLSVASSVAGNAEAVSVVNRSGAVRSMGLRPMTSACSEPYRSAINGGRLRAPSSIRRRCPVIAFSAARAGFVGGHAGGATCRNAPTPGCDGF